MQFSEYFGEANEMGLKDLNTLKSHVFETWSQWRSRKRLAVFGVLGVYVLAVAISSSLVVAISGGVVLLILRLWSIESELQYRLCLLGDLAITLQNHTQSTIEAVANELIDRDRR